MKLLILSLVMALSLNAGVFVGTSFAYSSADSKANINTSVGTASSTNNAYKAKVGYEFSKFRVAAYYQMDDYSKDIILVGEGYSYSYGLEGSYHYPINDKIGVLAGIAIGKGYKDLGSNSDSIAIGTIDFRDTKYKLGGTYAYKQFELEAGVVYDIRVYNTVQYSTYTINIDEKLIGLELGINYKF